MTVILSACLRLNRLYPAYAARDHKLHHIGRAFINRFYLVGRDDHHLPGKGVGEREIYRHVSWQVKRGEVLLN